ncbi:uncharacterized protein GIQ15_01539 [Arthroderma uncinatum]|uniref:uncharacterized protein n=1 Tax=Arthroderma uncinatum TaxID=74035 RepID=UPI00144AABCE|nr:uncharacterized protein GIQ15_01539 [Arthroderma uncinatum]KAF3492022.1 hypothetical protein GIQ15_01539 [Arthroderma uncinatum]
MEYVPALCAAGTIGIAPAGLALGRPETVKRPSTLAYQRASFFGGEPDTALSSPLSPRQQPLFSPLHEQHLHQRHHSSFGPGETPRPPRTSPPDSRTFPLEEELSTAAKLDALIQRTDEKILLRPRRENNLTILTRDVEESPCPEPQSVPNSGRPSSSWVRRLSTITSSVYGSSISSSRPQSPSVNSSNAPFFPQNRSSNPPNKLVKRSTSQLEFPDAFETAPSRPHRSSSIIRRPATSHQRTAAAMRHRSATESHIVVEEDIALVSPRTQTSSGIRLNGSPSPDPEPIWRPYFRGIASNFSSFRTRRRSSSVRQRRERSHQHLHLLLEPDVVPTLVLASSIKTNEPIHPRFNSTFKPTEQSDSTWGKAIPARDHISRESSSDKERAAPSYAANEPATIKEPKEPREPKEPTQPWEESIVKLERRQRASLDLKRTKNPDGELPRTSKSERLSGSSMRLRRRKNITDPEIFQRPNTSYHRENSSDATSPKTSQDDDIVQKPRLRHSPQFKDLRYEVLNERRSAPSSTSGSRQSSAEQKIYITRDRDQRHSAAASDPASTIPGSDNDTRIFSSGDEDETDCHSDTAFDSFPTRATSSHKSTSRGPRIDTIFDQPDGKSKSFAVDEQHQHLSVSSIRRRSDVPNGSLRNISPSESGLKSDVRRMTPSPKTIITGPQRASRKSSYPTPSADSAEKLRLFAETSDNEDDFPMTLGPPPKSRSAVTLSRASDVGSRMSVFDWSEQQKPTKDGDCSVYRPKTAHEKNLADSRGGRAAARSAPNTLHLRSQSVPIAKESAGQKDTGFPLKFGTWGLGNKGPSEDWDGDFDFEDSDQPTLGSPGGGMCTTNSMKVPQSILDRQESVHGQYGHVQELTVLVEELKRLQVQAKSLHIMDGQSGELWKEAQGIINLATLEEEDEVRQNGCKHQRQRSSSSATFDSGMFGLESSPEPMPMPMQLNNNENLNKPSLSLPGKENSDPNTNINATFPFSKKPRRESSAKARSVLDNIHHLRDLHDVNATIPLAVNDNQQRFAFDTQSLRDLVVRAGVITRSLKDIVRKAEGVYVPPEPNHLTPDPPFSQIFVHPSNPITTNGLS